MIKPFKNPIYVTKPLNPKSFKLTRSINKIFNSYTYTNNGPYVEQLENKLCNYLQVKNLSLCANGTLGLILACKALNLTDEVITTPFTFPATTQALEWCGLKPVFCDIESDSLNIDPTIIEQLITDKTSAILGVHLFGVRCNTEAIQDIANKYNLKVIYDAAHIFAPALSFEHENYLYQNCDISVHSYHATKIFHTLEGGAVISRNNTLKNKIDSLINFGFEPYCENLDISSLGLNAKMDEVRACIGIHVLDLVNKEIKKRSELFYRYRDCLNKVPGITILIDWSYSYNCAYFPVLINKHIFGIDRNELHYKLKDYNIYAKKYFSPLIPEFSYNNYEYNCPIAKRISDNILVLPLHGSLKLKDINKICNIIKYLGE